MTESSITTELNVAVLYASTRMRTHTHTHTHKIRPMHVIPFLTVLVVAIRITMVANDM